MLAIPHGLKKIQDEAVSLIVPIHLQCGASRAVILTSGMYFIAAALSARWVQP